MGFSSPFQNRRLRGGSSSSVSYTESKIAIWWRRNLNRHPFALFGLPFILTIVAGSFFLTPATAMRYEQHDRKVQQMTREQELGLGKNRRPVVDASEEYYRLAAKDLDNWEQKRVKRLPGENDGTV